MVKLQEVCERIALDWMLSLCFLHNRKTMIPSANCFGLSFSLATSLILGFGMVSSSQAAPAKAVFLDGQAQIVPEFQESKEWIRENLWVETEFDSDRNGKKDRVHVGVTRQKQTRTEGLKVPVIYESSPYFAGNTGSTPIDWDVKHELGTTPPPRKAPPQIKFDPTRTIISNSLISSWVPRGFAVVHSEAPGTGRSQGSPTVGGKFERLAPKAVIDWLNGRAKGFTTPDGTTEIKADWCTGKVGMTGTSYNGTLAIAAATTGVKGLEAIIPVAPNTSYYHYYRSNGIVRGPGGWIGEDIDSLFDFINSGDTATRVIGNKLYRDGEIAAGMDRKTGDYNRFWESRDLLPHAKNIKCAVLMAHAFNDWNVMPEHSVRISQAIKGRVPLVQYFHQGGHGGNPPMFLMNRWFTEHLYGVAMDLENDPKAYIVRERAPGSPRTPSPEPTPYPDYPNPLASPVTLHLTAGGNTIGKLGLDKPKTQGLEIFTDDVALTAPALAALAESPNRLIFAAPELTNPVHLSGTAQIKIRLASSAPAANLSVYLVQLPWTPGAIGTSNLITRGWADPQNAGALKSGGSYNSLAPGKPLVPGKFVDLTFDLQPDDQIIPAGKQIALMILSSDKDFTIQPKPGTKLTVDLDHTKITLPIVGGTKSFLTALSKP